MAKVSCSHPFASYLNHSTCLHMNVFPSLAFFYSIFLCKQSIAQFKFHTPLVFVSAQIYVAKKHIKRKVEFSFFVQYFSANKKLFEVDVHKKNYIYYWNHYTSRNLYIHNPNVHTYTHTIVYNI